MKLQTFCSRRLLPDQVCQIYRFRDRIANDLDAAADDDDEDDDDDYDKNDADEHDE